MIAATEGLRRLAIFLGVSQSIGQAIGKTNDQGEEPIDHPYKPEGTAASSFLALGNGAKKECCTPSSRPVMLVREGEPIRELFASPRHTPSWLFR